MRCSSTVERRARAAISCDETVPGLPSLTFTTVSFPGIDTANPTSKELWFSFANNQPPGCDVFFEMEVYYRRPDGGVESYYLVFPRAGGVSKGTRTVAFTTKRDDAGSYGAFTRSGAFVTINNDGAVTEYRLRATNYAGVRPVWGPLICSSCQAPQ